MFLHSYLVLLTGAEQTLAASHHEVAAGHGGVADVAYTCTAFANQCETRAAVLAPFCNNYPAGAEPQPDRLDPTGLEAARPGPLGLLRDLADLYQLATFVSAMWEVIGQAAYGARDSPLIDLAAKSEPKITAQLAWLRMRMKAEAPQVLLVAS